MKSENTKELFGAAVRHARIRAGITQEDLAKRLDIDPKTIGRIESGLKDMMFSTALRLADVLGSNVIDMTHKEEQSFEDARKIFIETIRFYLNKEFSNHIVFSARSCMEKIKYGITNAEILAWVNESLSRMHNGDDLEEIVSLIKWLGESPKITGAIAAAEIRANPFYNNNDKVKKRLEYLIKYELEQKSWRTLEEKRFQAKSKTEIDISKISPKDLEHAKQQAAREIRLDLLYNLEYALSIGR